MTTMTPTRRKLIAAVHAAAKDRGLDEDTRRDKIALVTGGKRSAADCTDAQLRQVLDAINGAGRPSGRRPAGGPTARKARALWLSLYALGAVSDPSETALRAWVKRQYQVDDLAFVRPSDGFAVIEGLKRWAARIGVNWALAKDPRSAILAAQWKILTAAGTAPAADLDTHGHTVTGAPLLTCADARQRDRLINDLGRRVRATKGIADV